jgi:hypothetical protein
MAMANPHEIVGVVQPQAMRPVGDDDDWTRPSEQTPCFPVRPHPSPPPPPIRSSWGSHAYGASKKRTCWSPAAD